MGQLQRRNSELVDLLSADFINCWIPIDQVIIAECITSVTFADIPQDFRSLALLGQIRSSRAAELDGVVLRFNGDIGNNYNYVEAAFFCSDTVSTVCSRGTSRIRSGKCDAANSHADTFAPYGCLFPGYARVDRTKWSQSLQSGPMGDLSADADMQIVINRGLWERTEPITSITIFPEIGPDFANGCIFELYGVL